MADVFSKTKRSQVMAAIRSKGNKDTELRLAAIFRAHGITGWRRNQRRDRLEAPTLQLRGCRPVRLPAPGFRSSPPILGARKPAPSTFTSRPHGPRHPQKGTTLPNEFCFRYRATVIAMIAVSSQVWTGTPGIASCKIPSTACLMRLVAKSWQSR